MSLRNSSPDKEGAYRASKWIRLYILCDEIELASLFDEMKLVFLYPIGKVFQKGPAPIDPAQMIQGCAQVVQSLQNKQLDTSLLNLPLVMTKQEEALYQYSPKQDRFLLQIAKPVIQWQVHRFRYSPIDGKVRSMVFGQDSIFWGFECAFPTVFQDPKSGQIVKVDTSFANFSLFTILRRWIRKVSQPTSFLIQGKKIVSSIRLGKNCSEWIHKHPELALNNIAVL